MKSLTNSLFKIIVNNRYKIKTIKYYNKNNT